MKKGTWVGYSYEEGGYILGHSNRDNRYCPDLASVWLAVVDDANAFSPCRRTSGKELVRVFEEIILPYVRDDRKFPTYFALQEAGIDLHKWSTQIMVLSELYHVAGLPFKLYKNQDNNAVTLSIFGETLYSEYKPVTVEEALKICIDHDKEPAAKKEA